MRNREEKVQDEPGRVDELKFQSSRRSHGRCIIEIDRGILFSLPTLVYF